MRLHLQTKELLPNNVGNALNCTSCHLNAGTVADGSPFVGVSAFFPSYAPRAGKVVSLEERINGCFRRSMNGKPLPAESADMQAMVAYFDWMKNNTQPEDKVAGRGGRYQRCNPAPARDWRVRQGGGDQSRSGCDMIKRADLSVIGDGTAVLEALIVAVDNWRNASSGGAGLLANQATRSA